MKFKYRLTAVIVVMIMLITAGCKKSDKPQKNAPAPSNSYQDISPDYGGTLMLACFVPDTLNPLATQYQNIRDILMIIYEGLFRAERDLSATPVLADGYSVSTSNKIYTIKLKQNVSFHDGSKFDATDVIATFNYIKSYPTPYSTMFENVLSFDMIDDYTISIELISPQLDFINNLDFPILPSGLSKEAFTAENEAFVPMGTGKFKYAEQVPGKSMTCKRADNIYDNTEVYIENIQINYLRNTQDIFYAFDAGEIDMFTTDGSNWGEFAFTSDVRTFETVSTRYMFMGVNVNNEHLQDASLRRDINRIIDKKAMVESVMFSHATPANLPVISTAYYNKQARQQQAPDAASSAPGAAAATPVAEEDALEKPAETAPEFSKYNITLSLMYNNESKEKYRAAQFIKTALEPYGIVIELDAVDFETYKQRILEDSYNLYIGETVMDNNMNMDFMFNSLHKSEQRLCNYTDVQFDTLLNNLDMAAQGSENSEIVYRNFVEYFEQNMPQIPLFHTNAALFVSSRIKGNVDPGMSHLYSDIASFYINYNQ